MIAKLHSVFSAFVLCALSSQAFADIFGYYHAGPAGVLETMGHTNIVHVQSANSLEPLDVIAETHPAAGIVFEFSALTLKFRGIECRYNKCHVYDEARVALILDSVAAAIAPYKGRIKALMIADEVETNPPTLDALKRLVGALKAHPELRAYSLWVNYDNVIQSSSGVPFVLTEGLDFVSLTPNYGRMGYYSLYEMNRYTVLLDSAARATHKPRLMVVGDGFGFIPDTNSNGLTSSGVNHLEKIDKLYNKVAAMASQKGIEVAGEMVFAWDRHPDYPNEFAVAQAPDVIKSAWKQHALRITGHSPTCNDD